MKLYHVTNASNVDSIRREGIWATSWLVSLYRIEWAKAHVAETHGWRDRDLVVFVVRVPRAWVVRTGGKITGRWRCLRLIPPERIF